MTSGGLFAPVIAMFFVAAFESASPSFTLNSTVLEAEGLVLLVSNWIERSAVW